MTQARIATAGETVACEREVIEKGTSAWTLMRRAGELAAALTEKRYADRLPNGAVVYAGTGNNGGDAWVVAAQLAGRGIKSAVIASGDPRTDESIRARADALSAGVAEGAGIGSETVIIDGLLGTGSTGAPRGNVAAQIEAIRERRAGGAAVVALDLPSGLDATTGDHEGAVTADLTVTFGTMKRGHLLARHLCGIIEVVDIGLDCEANGCLPVLVDEAWVSARVPRIPFAAHKGTRKTLAVIGGGKGMAGAGILAGEGALRAGIGLLRVVVAEQNEVAVHASLPAAIVATWPRAAADIEHVLHGVDAVAIGPGLGNTAGTRDLVERVLLAWTGPVVVDADALNVFQGDMLSLSQLLRGRPAVLTPHPAEMARLVGVTTTEVIRDRFDIGLDIARELGAAVLLKGVPTVVFSPGGERFVCARGTAALATGGSGDVLTGMTGTLLAQLASGDIKMSSAEIAACAAFVHGLAAEIAGPVRGTTLSDILDVMPRAWDSLEHSIPDGVITRLENVT